MCYFTKKKNSNSFIRLKLKKKEKKNYANFKKYSYFLRPACFQERNVMICILFSGLSGVLLVQTKPMPSPDYQRIPGHFL
jgi:predicted nucleotidyltransferase